MGETFNPHLGDPMNCDTGHLVTGALFDQLVNTKRSAYEPLPPSLHEAAARKLQGLEEAIVAKASGGKLSKYAAGRRKAKRREARDSRRQNRS